MTIYNSLLIFCWFIFLGYWIISAFNTKRNISTAWRWFGFRALLVIVIIGFLEIHGKEPLQTSITPVNPLLGSIGVLLSALGIAFAIWARTHLGRNWGMPMTIKEKPELVTSGPYAYVRHPIYTGVLLAILGSTLIAGPWWLFIFIVAFLYFLYSAFKEERVMANEFPTAYPEYKQKTKMLIPFVF